MKEREFVEDIMSRDVQQAHPRQNLLEVREMMEQFGIRHVPVVDGGEVVGIISRTDIMRLSYGLTRAEEEANKDGLQIVKVAEAMSPHPVLIPPKTTIREAAEVLAEMDFSALPVVSAGQLVGIVTTADLIRFLLELY